VRDIKPTAQNQPNGKAPTECQARGCPLPGVYRLNNDASLCCVHDGEDPSAWPVQTERIRSHLRLWQVTLAMSNALVGERVKPATVEAVTAEGGPDDSDSATQRSYAQKIRVWLMKQCKGEHKTPVQLTPIKSLVEKLTHL
jgi:hypothetical protein